MASGPADLRPAHPVTRNPFIQAAGVDRTAHAPPALGGFRSVYNGADAAEDDERRSTRRSELRLGSLLQPGSAGPIRCGAGRSACGRSLQYFPGTSLFSRNLFSDAEEVVVAAGRSREPPNDPEAAQRGSVPMDAPRKFWQPRSVPRNAQRQREVNM